MYTIHVTMLCMQEHAQNKHGNTYEQIGMFIVSLLHAFWENRHISQPTHILADIFTCEYGAHIEFMYGVQALSSSLPTNIHPAQQRGD